MVALSLRHIEVLDSRYFLQVMTLLTWLLLCLPGTILAHPQCLDSSPPFQSDVQFCLNYSDFGCCTPKQDAEIAAKYEELALSSTNNDTDDFIVDPSSESPTSSSSTMGVSGRNKEKRGQKIVDASGQNIPFGSAECADKMRQVLCTQCDPYAAHVFDSELSGVPLELPGLCPDFCARFYSACRSYLELLTNDLRMLEAIAAGSDEFCRRLTLPDMDYCYPAVLSGPDPLPTEEPSGNETCFCMEEVASGFYSPINLIAAGDGSNRMFVVEQRGVIWAYHGDSWEKLSNSAFLDITDRVTVTNSGGEERGLLSLSFHPEFVKNGRFFVFYNRVINQQLYVTVSEFQLNPDGPPPAQGDLKGDPSSEKVVFDVGPKRFSNHNGGQLWFGSDGYLYVSTGDGGSGGDPDNHGQNVDSAHGKILRLDVDSGSPYSIPADNPYGPSNPVWAIGFRNPYRCTVDIGYNGSVVEQDRIFCADVGQSSREEVTLALRGGNHGWKWREGTRCFAPSCRSSVLLNDEVLPIHDYGRSDGKSIIGGYVYRGSRHPELTGRYFFGDYVTSRLWTLEESPPDSNRWARHDVSMCRSSVCSGEGLQSTYGPKISSFGQDEHGEVFLVSMTKHNALTEAAGSVYRYVHLVQNLFKDET